MKASCISRTKRNALLCHPCADRASERLFGGRPGLPDASSVGQLAWMGHQKRASSTSHLGLTSGLVVRICLHLCTHQMKMVNHLKPENRIDFDSESRYSMAFPRKVECPSTTSSQNREDSSSGSEKIELARKALRILAISQDDFIFCKYSRAAKIDHTLFIC
jgi:hypothetical protein